MQDLALELTAATLTTASVLTAIRERWTTWLYAAGSALLYLYVYYAAGLHVSAQMQFVYLGLSAYGLYKWRRGEKGGKAAGAERVKWASRPVRLAAMGILLGLMGVLYYLNQGSAGAEYVLYDAFLVSASVTAQGLMTHKYVECWALWVVVNIGYLPLLFAGELWFTLAVYMFLFYFTVKGAREWYQQLNSVNQVTPV